MIKITREYLDYDMFAMLTGLSFCTDFPMEKYDQKLPHLTWDKRPTANKELEQPKSELVHNVLQTSDGRRQYQKFELLSIFSGVCDNQPQEQ